MGYLLKEALKTLCGVNQWSYAIFWRIGCQNPKLLIWEECYYENSGTSVSKSDYEGWSETEMNSGQLEMQADNRVHFLITKMMMDNQVNVIGEGLVGRAALTGSHQWILSHNYTQAAYPPVVLKEVFQQFSAGMQTIAVIPVLPHGVVQLASDMPVMENTVFVDEVKNLVLQLGCVPGILLSESYTSTETTPKIGIPVGKSTAGTLKPLVNESCNYNGELADKSTYAGLLNVMFPPSSSLPMPHATQYEAEMTHSANARHSYMTQVANSVAKAEAIPANPEMWLNQPTFGCFPRSKFDMQPSVGSSSLGGRLSMIEQQILAGRAVQEHSSSKLNVSGGLLTVSMETNSGLVSTSSQGFRDRQPAAEGELYGVAMGSLSSFSNFGSLSNANPPSNTNDSGLHQGVSRVKISSSPKPIMSSSSVSENSGMNKVLTSNFSSGYSSIDNYIQKDVADVVDDLDYDLYKSLSVPQSAHAWSKTSSESMPGNVCKEEMEDYQAHGGSAGDFSYGVNNAELCSGDDLFDVLRVDFKNKLVILDHKPSSSVSTCHSKKTDDTGKSNRKRLKPGENPRPRPKDRQMIQDRVKELREIVPNGEKCSIDALLERTIKHMLFLQSITKHADKLKQSGESKIFSKESGHVTKANCDGGATWAYEVGSQSMVCPIIIVEDLNQPRQMLVEMLCEERGLVLEIAEIIRGLGLTILKGVMEAQKDKIWARFAVEANRDVTRMEIFISLVRLLKQNIKNGVPAASGMDNNTMMAQQFRLPDTSIPATGRSCGL